METWTKHTPDADGRYRYLPQHVIRLELNDGEVRAWTTPNAEPPWTAEHLATGLRRTSPTTSIQVDPITQYRGGPQITS